MTQDPSFPQFTQARRDHGADTIQLLHEIPDMAAEAAITHNAPNPTARAERSIRATPASRPPTDLDILDALRPAVGAVHFELNQAVRAVWEDHRDLALDEPSVTTDCAWLIRHAHAWQSDPFLSDWVESTVAAAHRVLAGLVRQAPPLRLACPRCQNPVHAEAGGSFFRCEAGHVIDHHAEVRRMGALQHAPLGEVADLLAIPSGTLRRWAADGLISPAPGAGRPRLYAIADVRNVAERVRRR